MAIPKGMANNFGAIYTGGVKHYGLDIPPPTNGNDAVVAPERCIVESKWTDDTTAPFVGYGPGGLLLRGDSGVWHLLAHLDPSSFTTPADGTAFAEGEQLGLIARNVKVSRTWSAPHVHWEVRTKPLASHDENLDPVAWLAGKRERLPKQDWVTWLLVGAAIYLALKDRRG
jgi:hypothetical protein